MDSMKRRALLFVAAALALCASSPALAVDPPAAIKPEFVMKLATVAPDRTPWSELLKKYKAAVETKSGQRIQVKIFLGGQLGDENESVNKCKRGQIQAVGASTGALASQVPELNVVELPFLFRTAEEADTVVDTVITPAMDRILPKYGLVLGFWSENGFRQFGLKDKAVHSPADLKGKKMRSQESPVHQEMWNKLGAIPSPIPSTEALTALETGTVDGFDQATLFAVAASWHKTVKFYTVSDHIYQPALIVFNQKWFESLPADLRQILVEEGRTMQTKGRLGIRKINPGLVKLIEKEGVKVNTLTPEERSVFEKATASVRNFLRNRQKSDETGGLLDAVEAKLKSLRGGK
jgi:TRAP-type C4-dicarboxylate transport system substrate-binding protein